MASETQDISRVLGQIEGRLNEHSRRFDDVDARFDRMDARFDSMWVCTNRHDRGFQ